MKMPRTVLSILPVAAAGIVAAAICTACNSEGCTDNHSALPLMGFYSAVTGEAITLDSIAVGGVGAPGDSLLVAPGQAVQQVYLPFRYGSDATSFFIHYDYPAQGIASPELNDTITFRYTAEPFFASEDCGAMFRYRISAVEHTHHILESVEITDSVVTNVERERFMLYFRTTDNPQRSQAAGRGLRP